MSVQGQIRHGPSHARALCACMLLCAGLPIAASATLERDPTSARLHALTGTYAEASAAAARILRESAPPEVAFAWLRANAEALDVLHDVGAARLLWRQAGAVAEPRWPLRRIAALNASARLSLEAGDFDAAREDAERARSLAHTYADPVSEAEADFCLGNTLRLRGDVDGAMRFAQQAHALALRNGDEADSARALTLMATIAKNRGDYIQGLEYEIEALRQEPPGNAAAQALTLSKLGKLYEQIEDNAQALEYAERALKLAEGDANRETAAHIFVGYANTLNDLNPEQHERALSYAERALGYAVETGHRTIEIDASLQVARAQFNGGALDAAERTYDQVLTLARRIGQKASVAHILLRQSELFERLGRIDAALANTRDAIALYRDSDNLPRLIKAYAILERQLSAKGDAAGAQLARLQRFELRDRVLGARAMRNLAQIEAKRSQDSQRQQIELLKRQGEIDALRLERGSLVRWLVALLAVSLGVALALVLRRFRRSQRVNRLLHGKNTEILAQQEALRNANAELERSAASLFAAVSTDALTGAFSRAHGLQLLHEAIVAANPSGPPCSVLLIDVDHFKQVNDRHGHLQGDRALAALAQHLRSALRVDDALVRFGGEEFLVVLPRTTLQQAAAMAESLRRHVESLGPAALPGAVVTISIGVCAAVQLARATLESVIEAADQALYAAKNGGRNRVVVYGDAISAALLPAGGEREGAVH